jgi:hypothetical protein
MPAPSDRRAFLKRRWMMVDCPGRSDPTRQFRLLAAVLLGTWLAAPASGAATTLDCDYDQMCETGENCGNCSDCAGQCYCGDEACTGGESCGSCPEDCYASCVCGDYSCDYPAEGGGLGSAVGPCSLSGFENCTFCEEDCGECENGLCDPGVCDEESGDCRDCRSSGECAESQIGHICAWFGQCVQCDDSGQCGYEICDDYSCRACENDNECAVGHGPGYKCGGDGACVYDPIP